MIFSMTAIKLVLGGFFPKLLEFFAKYWKQILFLSMFAFIVYQNTSETRFVLWIDTIPSLEKRIVLAKEEVEHWKEEAERAGMKLDEISAEVIQWKEKSVKLEQEYKKLEGKVNTIRTNTQTDARTILGGDTPKTCEAAIDYLREGTRELQW